MAEWHLGTIEVTVTATIRPSREADLPALEWMGLYTPHRHIIQEAFRAQERGDALMLLAVAAEFPIAQVWIDFARKRQERVAVFWAIRTFYPLQGVGIGTRMMRAAEKAARRRGFAQGELEVEKDNWAALRFYRRLGWREIGKDDQSRNIMAREFSGF